MRALTILRRLIGGGLQSVHARRRTNVFALVDSLLRGDRLSLTALGRSLRGPVAPRHKIKRVDRVLGNKHLHGELPLFYQVTAHALLRGVQRPVILVDWTDLGWGFVALAASVAQDGRSLPIYVEVHPAALYANPDKERAFLQALHDSILPKGCRPVVVTDAGFQNPWFRVVTELGWDFLGRLSKRVWLEELSSGDCRQVRDIKPEFEEVVELGENTVTRSRPIRARVVATRRRLLGRSPSRRVNRKGVHPNSSVYQKYRSRAKEPWVLVTSLAAAKPSEIIGLYRRRMCIEQSFRDAKSHRFGWTFEDARCTTAERWQVLLLVASLAMAAVYLLGCAGEALGLHHRHQANSIRHRRVLSRVRLGRILDSGSDHRHLTWGHIARSLAGVILAAEAQG